MQTDQKPIVGAIILAGAMIAAAILLKGSSGGSAENQPVYRQIGLNARKFEACMESGKWKEKVDADVDDGIRAGVNGTPTSFIVKNGVVIGAIGGAQPFEKVIEQLTAAETGNGEPLRKDAFTEGTLPEEDGNAETAYVEIRPVSADDHIAGNSDAEIFVVEYSDFDCPFCKNFHGTMQRVLEEKSNVAWVYRHFPIPQLHPDAFRKAEESECAWELGGNKAFWKYADKIFGAASQ